MATARDLIRTNTGPQSGLIFDANYEDSSFTPKGWGKYHNYSTQKQEITAVNATQDAFGTTLEFRPAKNADYYGFVVAQTPVTAITPGANCSYSRFVDYLGCFIIDSIRVSHVSNLLVQLDMNVYYHKYVKDSDARKRFHQDPMLLGNLSPFVRDALATQPQVALTPLDGFLWFTYSTSSFIPVIVLSHELRFEVTYKAANQVIQSDVLAGTATIAPVSIKGITYNPALIFMTCHVTGNERTWQCDLFERDGIMMPFKEYKSQPRVTILANQSGVIPIRLTSLKDQISELYFVIRRQTDVQTNYGNNPTRQVSWVSYSFVGNGGEMVPVTTYEWNNQRIKDQFHSAWHCDKYKFGIIPSAWIPEDPINNTGSWHLGIINDPIIYINVGTAAGQSEAFDLLNGTGTEPAQNLVVDVIEEAFNWLHMVGGDINKTFN